MKYLIAVSLMILSGCVGITPSLDTHDKKLLAAEISFQEMAKLALASQDRLSASSKAKVKSLLEDAHKALVAARVALNAGNQLDFTNSLTAANSLITVIRPLLIELEQSNVGIQHYSSA